MKTIKKYKNGYNIRQTKNLKYHVYTGTVYQAEFTTLKECRDYIKAIRSPHLNKNTVED